MKIVATILTLLLLILPASAQDISVGPRITVDSEWHQANGGPYTPLIVACESSTGMCVRDTRNDPPNVPIETIDGGMRVEFTNWNIAYIFLPDGVGQTTDLSGNVVGEITWSQDN